MKGWCALLGGLVMLAAAMPTRADVTLVMIRHGEKPEAGLGNCPAQGRRHGPHGRATPMTTYRTPMTTCVFLVEILKEDQFSHLAGSNGLNKQSVGCSMHDHQYLVGHQSTGAARTSVRPLPLHAITIPPLSPWLVVDLVQPG